MATAACEDGEPLWQIGPDAQGEGKKISPAPLQESGSLDLTLSLAEPVAQGAGRLGSPILVMPLSLPW
jgi:hypothetical protein